MLNEKTSILVVDDHVLIRTGVMNLLKDEPDIFIAGEAESGEEAVKLARELKPDIILMDISMSGITGLQAAEQIKKENSAIRIILLTIYKSEEYFIEASKKGVEGILHKNISKEELLDAVRKVRKGEKYIGQKFAQMLADYYNMDVTRNIVFTRREKEILNLIAHGNSNSDIADTLNLSVRTIETHKSNLIQKLNLKGASALTKFAIENFKF
jgi:DNA-binding NarL/FixJ family response regulator